MTATASIPPLTRIEHDLLGERDIPAATYWGIHTLRAQENFQISGTRISAYPDLIRALALVKQAAARQRRSQSARCRQGSHDRGCVYRHCRRRAA